MNAGVKKTKAMLLLKMFSLGLFYCRCFLQYLNVILFCSLPLASIYMIMLKKNSNYTVNGDFFEVVFLLFSVLYLLGPSA